MSFKISGVELVRRLRVRVPEFESMATHCLEHASEIRKRIEGISDIVGRGRTTIVPDPEQIWQARAEGYSARAADLQWLSDSIVENQVHDVSGEDLMALGIIGATGAMSMEYLVGGSPEED
ncbi:hypothetical protein LCGC14_1094800 [marine sediment metagenome]|uniref:Uncharacterized protein n=1 Tax=marine sediment metagenome TaxID=412755 RepID=A0A0F9MZ27_9ZZZZ